MSAFGPIKKLRSQNFELNKVLDKISESFDQVRLFLNAVTLGQGSSDIGFVLPKRSIHPPNPVPGQVNFYVKDDNLVVQMNDSGVIRYKYLPVTGTSATWVHSTTAP